MSETPFPLSTFALRFPRRARASTRQATQTLEAILSIDSLVPCITVHPISWACLHHRASYQPWGKFTGSLLLLQGEKEEMCPFQYAEVEEKNRHQHGQRMYLRREVPSMTFGTTAVIN